ncbi:MAG: FAD-dependent oxidoreductase, partial [Chloroflexota bacterium]
MNEKVVAVLHARRCGWLSAQQLGMFLLEQARACGARLVRGRVEQVEVAAGRVQAVRLSAGSQPDRL